VVDKVKGYRVKQRKFVKKVTMFYAEGPIVNGRLFRYHKSFSAQGLPELGAWRSVLSRTARIEIEHG
jgi:hypothetical protein